MQNLIKIFKNKTIILKLKNLYKINNFYIKNFQIIIEKIYFNNTIKWILIFHAFSSSHHSIGIYIKNIKNLGWWDIILNNIIKKNFNVITISNINTPYGSTNNKSKNPFNNKNYNFNFPIINIIEIIKIKNFFLKKIKINNIFISIGGSMGGIEVLIWSIMYPNYNNFSICIATYNNLSLNNKILNNINCSLIKTDYNNYLNKYYKYKILNLKGLKLSRIISHLSYLSKNDLKSKIKKIYYKKNYIKYNMFSKISNYLNYQGNIFLKYFNSESYIYILNLNKNFRIKNTIKNFFTKLKNINNYFIISFIKDKRFHFKNSTKIIKNILYINKSIFYKIIKIPSGHDSFLIKNNIYIKYIVNYIKKLNKSER